MERKAAHRIPVVLALTPGYFVAAATCLQSIFKHADNHAHFHVICLLAEELSPAQEADLQALRKSNTEFTFIALKDQLAGIYVDQKYTIATMFRLLIPELLPQYDKVIYLDCDIIVRHDLEALYLETDLEGYYLAGVKEVPLDFQLAHLRTIGAEKTYINAGFLLMNLKALRQDQPVSKFLSSAKQGGQEFFDQDILNIHCKGRILFLPPHHNSIRTFFLPQYKPEFLTMYPDEAYQQVLHQGTVHYTGAKPWNTFTVQFKIWWHYYELLPGKIKAYGQVNSTMRLLSRLYRNPIGSALIDSTQFLYRKIKYGWS